jgi:hypothetical protein
MRYGPWRMAGRWARCALARCPPGAGSWCEVLPSRWICMAGILPHSCARRKTVRRGSWGRYVSRTEGLRSWDIQGSNDRLNRVFELNRLSYGVYLGEDATYRRGKKPMGVTEEGPSQEAAPAIKKRRLGTAVGEVGVSNGFAVELMGTCAAPEGRMSSPELRESSARMLEVTGGRWPKNVPIPWAEGEDMSTSRIARGLRIFPYGRNIAAVVSAVMNKDRQDAAQKRRAVVRIADPRCEAKRARGSMKAAAPGSSQPMPAAKPAAPGSSKVSASVKTAASSGTKPPPGGSAKGRELPSPGRRVSDFGSDISVEDYFVGKFFLTSELLQGRVRSSWLLSRLRRQRHFQRWQLGGRVPRKTRGPLFARAARSHQPLPPRTWRVPCPGG